MVKCNYFLKKKLKLIQQNGILIYMQSTVQHTSTARLLWIVFKNIRLWFTSGSRWWVRGVKHSSNYWQ